MIDKKRGLGRGLDDLLSTSDWLKRDDIKLFYCPVERLVSNPFQPRQIIDDAHLEDLVLSIKEKGVLQPILATATATADQYQILAGERRWRASKLAGLSEVPVILRESTSAEALELALIENIQRRDLNCIEEALAYQRLQDEFELTQEEIARRVGKNRSTVANLLRLLQLPTDIQEQILNEKLSMGHARALLSVTDPERQKQLRDLILSRHLSVRQTEQLAARATQSSSPAPPVSSPYAHIQDALQSRLGAPVLLRRRGQKGSITLSFTSDSEFHRLLEFLGLPQE
jgi:ParB family chromosome partitioning protein